MIPSQDVKQFDVILIGGGHANIQVIRRFAMEPILGVRMTLIADSTYAPYSGMLPGFLTGDYSFDQTHFDLRAICERAQVRFIHSEVNSLSAKERKIGLKGRPEIEYDIAALNVGISPKPFSRGPIAENFFPLKPIRSLLRNWEKFTNAIKEKKESFSSENPLRVGVIGAGAAGFEVSIAISIVLKREKIPGEVHLIGKKVLRGHGQRAQRLAKKSLQEHQIQLHVPDEARGFQNKRLQLNERELELDFVFGATEAQAPAWLRDSDLALSDSGFVKVDHFLKAHHTDSLFAAGDCIDFCDRQLPKAGVFAVRQGPVLSENIRRALFGRPLKKYQPQQNTLALLKCGPGSAIASYAGTAVQSSLLWKWKDKIDRTFMERFQNTSEEMSVSATQSVERPDFQQNLCGGCGTKVPASVLSRSLEKIKSTDAYLLSEDLGKDDTAVLSVPRGVSLLNHLDAFQTFISDPYLFGKIAVEHSLNDIYAMGGTPYSAQSLISVQQMATELVERDFFQMLSGVCASLSTAGVRLAGGHSVEGATHLLGVGVLGSSETPMAKKIPATGSLILTKPLGTGVLLKAHMEGKARGEWIDELLNSMILNQARASEILVAEGAQALTDVTGFGLAGHSLEMIGDGPFDIELWQEKLPLLNGALQLAHDGWETVRGESHRQHWAEKVVASEKIAPLLFDPQTSGGLLGLVPEKQSEDCLKKLRSAGYFQAAIIGRVIDGTGKIICQKSFSTLANKKK